MIDWFLNFSYFVFLWSDTCNCPRKQILIFLTDSVIIDITYIIHTVVGIKSKPSKWNVIKLTAQKMKFSIKDFFSKYDQIRRHLLKKSLMEKLIFCAETVCSVYSKRKKRKRVTNFSSFLFEMKEENKNV